MVLFSGEICDDTFVSVTNAKVDCTDGNKFESVCDVTCNKGWANTFFKIVRMHSFIGIKTISNGNLCNRGAICLSDTNCLELNWTSSKPLSSVRPERVGTQRNRAAFENDASHLLNNSFESVCLILLEVALITSQALCATSIKEVAGNPCHLNRYITLFSLSDILTCTSNIQNSATWYKIKNCLLSDGVSDFVCSLAST